MQAYVLRQIVQQAYYDHEALVTGRKFAFRRFVGNIGICLISTYDAAHACALTLIFSATYALSVHKFTSGWKRTLLRDTRFWADVGVILILWRVCFDLMTSAAHRPFRRLLRGWIIYILLAGVLDVVVEALWWLMQQLLRRELSVLDVMGNLYGKQKKIVEHVTGTVSVAYTVGKFIVSSALSVLPYISKMVKLLIWLKSYLSCLETMFLIVMAHALFVILNEGLINGGFGGRSSGSESSPVLPPVWSRWFVYISKVDNAPPSIKTAASPVSDAAFGEVEMAPLMPLPSSSTTRAPPSPVAYFKGGPCELPLKRRSSVQPPDAIYLITPWYRWMTQCWTRVASHFCATHANRGRWWRYCMFRMQRANHYGSMTVSYTIWDTNKLQILIDRVGDADSIVRLDGVVVDSPITSPRCVNITRYSYAGSSHERRRGVGALLLQRRRGLQENLYWSVSTVNEYKVAEIRARASGQLHDTKGLLLVGDSRFSLQTLCVVAFDLFQLTPFKTIICVGDYQALSELKFLTNHVVAIGDGWQSLDTKIANVLLIDAKLSPKSIWRSGLGLSIAAAPGTNFICHSDSNNFRVSQKWGLPHGCNMAERVYAAVRDAAADLSDECAWENLLHAWP